MYDEEVFFTRPVAFTNPRTTNEISMNRAVQEFYHSADARKNFDVAHMTMVSEDRPDWIQLVCFGWTTEGFRVFVGTYNFDTYTMLRDVLSKGYLDLTASIASTPLDDMDEANRATARLVKTATAKNDCGRPDCEIHGYLHPKTTMTLEDITDREPPVGEWSGGYTDPAEMEDPE